jgi:hypothetical protein
MTMHLQVCLGCNFFDDVQLLPLGIPITKTLLFDGNWYHWRRTNFAITEVHTAEDIFSEIG